MDLSLDYPNDPGGLVRRQDLLQQVSRVEHSARLRVLGRQGKIVELLHYPALLYNINLIEVGLSPA